MLDMMMNYGQNQGFGANCPCHGSQGYNPMSGLSGLSGLSGPSAMGLSGLNATFATTMMTMMAQLMEMLGGQSGFAGGQGQFGGGGGGASPLGSFLGGASGGGGSTGGGGTATAAAPTGSAGAALGPTDGSTNSSTKNFIDKALSHQGAPYVFGAQGPNKFDCSGLVYYALKEAGVSGGRETARGYQQRYKDSAVKKEDLKPGDLVFFWSPNDRGIPKGQATHIEIYLGDGKTMGTDSPKEGAKVEPINWDTFIGGARVPQLNK